jgi:ureidoacrylate peracid hydrolase
MSVKECVLAIDVQNDFCEPRIRSGAIAGCEAAADNISRLAEAARRTGIPVVWVRTVHTAETDTPVWLWRHRSGDDTCRPGTPGVDFYRVRPLPGEPVVTKCRYNAFLRTDLEETLHALGVQRVLCCGFATNVCVESTARDAFQRDFHVSLVEDACRGGSEELHRSTCANIARHFGTVETTDAILARWTGVGSPAQPLAASS